MKAATYIISTGRSGTTLLAQYLTGHPELLIRSNFPYETRASQHLFVWASNGRSQSMLDPSKDAVNGVSYTICQPNDDLSEQWFRTNQHLLGGLRATDIACKYYEYLATIERKPNAKSYVEKAISISLVPRMHQWGWPLRCILLLRDPRDIFFSVKSFNKKRGFKSFGEETLRDKELFLSYINFFVGARDTLRKQNIPHIEVRYEDLIDNPKTHLERVTAFIGLRTDNECLQKMLRKGAERTPETNAHRTAQGDLTAGRWRTDASDQHRSIFYAHAARIQELGYTID